jgi:uncharacterized protein YjbI with pentapeptide repeats
MDQLTLNKILDDHKIWLRGEGGFHANLYNANLRNANLRNADLRSANLYSADLRNANLYSANLYNANLRNADLRNANLHNANLYSADLRNANLYNANLHNANLHNANLFDITMNWQSHDLIAEILRQHAGENLRHRMLAGLVKQSYDWCWGRLASELYEADKTWCRSVLTPFIKGDDEVPEELV